MKRPVAIFFLLVFGLSSFTFKTHYCYHHDGTRFHGDCGEYGFRKHKEKNYPGASVKERKYVCYDFTLEKQFTPKDYSIKNFHDYYFILPVCIETGVIISPKEKQSIPDFSCRGGPPLLTPSFRGPPIG